MFRYTIYIHVIDKIFNSPIALDSTKYSIWSPSKSVARTTPT